MEKTNENYYDPKDIKSNRVMAAISYLGILCLIPLLLKKDSHFAQFHAKQGLVLFITGIILSFVNIIPLLGQIVWLAAVAFIIVYSILGIVNCLKGKYWEIPILSEYAKKIKI